MTATQETPARPASAPADQDQSNQDRSNQDRSNRSRSNRSRLIVLAVAGVVVAGGGAAALTLRPDASTTGRGPSSNPTAAIDLPSQVTGLQRVAPGSDPTLTTGWLDRAKTAGHGAVVVGRTYSDGAQPAGRTLRLVMGRTDLTGQLEQVWAVGPGEAVGQAHCTNNTRLVKSTAARIRPTVMICWRTSAALSGYAVIIDPRAKTPVSAANAAAALDAGWQIATRQG